AVVESIIERGYKQIVGTFLVYNKLSAYVVPDDKRFGSDIYILKDNFNGAKNGYKVVVEIFDNSKTKKADLVNTRAKKDARANTKEHAKEHASKAGGKAGVSSVSSSANSLTGKVVEVLGCQTEVGCDILSVIRSYGLYEKFDTDVENEAKAVALDITEADLKGRLDLRGETIITIDGDDAKDLDDAIQVTKRKCESGEIIYTLGVHIADVAHYVKEGTKLDNSALERATSVYFPDRVIPMLPKILSNGMCSLNPKVDRLTLSCIMDINTNGQVISKKIKETVIHSKARTTYKEIDNIQKGCQKTIDKYKHLNLEAQVKLMDELADILNKRRHKRGSLDFNLSETKIIIDDKTGKIADIIAYERLKSHRIIEEFMLCANETIAEHFDKLDLPFQYRIHESPDPEKLESLQGFVGLFGHKFVLDGSPRSIQKLLEAIGGADEETIISRITLRSMQKAKYSPYCDGHFGLAAKYYTHFTSPIRRYPDLQIHRIIKYWLGGMFKQAGGGKIDSEADSGKASSKAAIGAKVDSKAGSKAGTNAKPSGKGLAGKAASELERLHLLMLEVAMQSSERERNAVEAERAVEDLKKAQYMQDFIGHEFEGSISSITSFGFFVELKNTIEGLVKIESLPDDLYMFDEKRHTLRGRRNSFRLGQSVKIIVENASTATRKIDFKLV
ncbi:MAG: VacB/RNase II family 3'-5' exoribonuclease, partial [Firmicutes bacterium]|nr:VacB/RNase II family 3'-5' exoribonuclease [Bacillota bacterium]